MASGLRIENRSQLDDFLARPDAARALKAASFEEVFFTIKSIGLADSLDLLPIVSGRQVRGFIDLDCWRKDQFVRKPFMEWIAAFIQAGPEETAKALDGIDEYVLSLFLKDIVHVYEIDRDDPPDNAELIFTPDSRFGVEPLEAGNEATTVGMLILDALFKYNPHLGSRILTQVRYTSRIELEETAYENKTRRLEVHGFVDYYEAISIYAGSAPGESTPDRDRPVEAIPGEETPGNLPSVFASSLSSGEFLSKALASVTGTQESERVAQELTALGNRILSANLVNLGELEGVRPSLEEMRDVLTIGLEYLTKGDAERAPDIFAQSYVQTIFKVGFDQVARLRDKADALVVLPGFRLSLLDDDDRELIESLRRSKPLLIEQGRYRNYRSVADVENASVRLARLRTMAEVMLPLVEGLPSTTFAQAFNTATLRVMLYGRFETVPLGRDELKDVEAWLKDGYRQPDMEVPAGLAPYAARWWEELRRELEPLAGKKLDPRFLQRILLRL